MTSLNVKIAQLLDPEFDYEAESLANTERYQRLVRDYEHDLNVVVAALPPGVALEVWVDQNGYGNAMLHTSESGTEAFTHGATCQEAAAKALLQWKQSIGGEVKL